MRSGGVSQDGSDRERKMAYEQRVAGREGSERKRRAVMGNLEGKREREKSFEVRRRKKATRPNLQTKELSLVG